MIDVLRWLIVADFQPHGQPAKKSRPEFGVRWHDTAFNDATCRVVPKRGRVRALQSQIRPRRKKFQRFPVSGIYNHVQRVLNHLTVIFLCLAAFGGRDALAQTALPSLGGTSLSAHHTQAKLILSMDAAYPDPGGRVAALVDLKMDPGWHTYWKNPGAAGLATKIEWQLPAGITVSSTGWPVPKKLPPIEVTTYGYEDEVVLTSILEIASNTPPGQVKIKAHISWLECKDVCVPASADVEATLKVASFDEQIRIGAENLAADPERARVVHIWQHSTPLPQHWLESDLGSDVRAWWERPTTADTRPLVIEWAGPQRQTDFYPEANEHLEIQGATEMFVTQSGNVGLRKLVKKFDGDWPKEISGLLVLPRSTNSPALTNSFRYIIAYDVKLPVSETAPTNKLIARGPIPPNPVGILDFDNWDDFLW